MQCIHGYNVSIHLFLRLPVGIHIRTVVNRIYSPTLAESSQTSTFDARSYPYVKELSNHSWKDPTKIWRRSERLMSALSASRKPQSVQRPDIPRRLLWLLLHRSDARLRIMFRPLFREWTGHRTIFQAIQRSLSSDNTGERFSTITSHTWKASRYHHVL